jgi:hypothetical protein
VADSCGWCWGMKYWRRWRCTAPPACRCIACVCLRVEGRHATGPWTKADSCGGLFVGGTSLEYFPVGFFRMICCRHHDASMRQDIIQNFGVPFSFQLFSSKIFYKIDTVALSFVFDKYCPIMD